MGVGRHNGYEADMKIIETNPYRQLGVYANSPIRERVANHNKLQAFLKVGKQVDFPLDLNHYLPPIHRTSETIAQADASLALPKEQLKYAQFWFIKATPLDDIAFNHLQAGNMDAAIDIWKKKDCVSSLQNRIVCALLEKDYETALNCSEQFYTRYLSDFIAIILGSSNDDTNQTLAFDFIDILCEEVGANIILPYITDDSWKEHVSAAQVKLLIASIEAAIEVAKSFRGKGSSLRYQAGIKLKNDTKVSLQQLSAFLPTTDLQYQMIVDKLGLEILQCGIDYFNGSNAYDAAQKAMTIQSYAMKIVVGKMAKDRCKENVNILQNIIDKLPPREVYTEDRAIHSELQKFCQLPETISHAVTLLNNVKPYLQTIKTKLGVSNTYYLKISTQVVGNALHNIIEEVNAVQQDEVVEIGGRQVPISMLLDRDRKLSQIRTVLQAAWNATKIMDAFDMEQEFRTNRYNQNRAILKDLCDQMGVSIVATRSYSAPRVSPSRPKSYQQPISQGMPSSNNSTSSTSKGPSGCLIALIVWIVLGCIAGGICVANDGDFAAGFCISGVIVLFFSRLFDN